MPNLPPSLRQIGRVLLIIALLGSLYMGGSVVTEWVEQQLQNWSTQKSIGVLLVLTLVYAVLLAIPFVPGVELGWALLMALGVKGLVLVYPATLLGLCTSFLIGRWIPIRAIERLLRWLHLYRAEQLLATVEPLDSQNRFAMLIAKAPSKLIPILHRHRYIALAVAFNLPGNSLIGGGGGIALLAGVSRLFTFQAFFLLVCIATAPIPITLLFMAWT